MAGLKLNDIQHKVVELLSSDRNTPWELKDILKRLRCNKKSLNQSLYDLKRREICQKIQETPPIWSLTSQGQQQFTNHSMTNAGNLPSLRTYNLGSNAEGFHQKKDRVDDLGEKLLTFLGKSTGPFKTPYIASAVGQSNHSIVNRTLNQLKRRNLVIQASTVPPSWKIHPDATPEAIASLLEEEEAELEKQREIQSSQSTASVSTPETNFISNIPPSHLTQSIPKVSSQFVQSSSSVKSQLIGPNLKELGKKVIELLQSYGGGPMTTPYITKTIGCNSNKDVNSALYELQNRNILKKASQSPPSWKMNPSITEEEVMNYLTEDPQSSLSSYDESGYSQAPFLFDNDHPFGGTSIPQHHTSSLGNVNPRPMQANLMMESKSSMPRNSTAIEDFSVAPVCNLPQKPQKETEIEADILKVLQEAEGLPIRAITIAQGIGKKSEREVHRLLYKLMKKNLVIQYSKQPSIWKIHPNALVASEEQTSTIESQSKTKGGNEASKEEMEVESPLVVNDEAMNDSEVTETILDPPAEAMVSSPAIQNNPDDCDMTSEVEAQKEFHDAVMDTEEKVSTEQPNVPAVIKVKKSCIIGNAVLMAIEQESKPRRARPISFDMPNEQDNTGRYLKKDLNESLEEDVKESEPRLIARPTAGRGIIKFASAPPCDPGKGPPLPPHMLLQQNQRRSKPGRGRGRPYNSYHREEDELEPQYDVSLIPYSRTEHSQPQFLPKNESYDLIPEATSPPAKVMPISSTDFPYSRPEHSQSQFLPKSESYDLLPEATYPAKVMPISFAPSTRFVGQNDSRISSGSKIPLSPLDLLRGDSVFGNGNAESNLMDDQNKLMAGLMPRSASSPSFPSFQPTQTVLQSSKSSFSGAPQPLLSLCCTPITTSYQRPVAQNSQMTNVRVDTTMGLNSSNMGNSNVSAMLNTNTFNLMNKSPISALTEFAQSRRLKLDIKVIGHSGPSHKPRFQLQVTIGNRRFPPIVTSNKKDGRREAADAALRQLMSEGQYNQQPATPDIPSLSTLGKTETHFDRMAALSHQAMNLLAARVTENLSGRKVLAALIMKRGPQDEGSVICLGTGNRCITGPQMSLEGHTVNDSHAEIITRRSFVRFLYNQLESYDPQSKSDDSCILEPTADGRFKIKNGITFHLYISTAPCGDGALFSPRDAVGSVAGNEDNRKDHNPTFQNAVQGILRTKIEGGEGTIPIDADAAQQTWDGIIRGERLRTMSCSDKVCRWNILGLQGALLSLFIEPIYLNSLTLGYLYDHGHLSRAVCCRLALGESPLSESVPDGFRLNHPHLGRVTVYEPQRGTEKTNNISLNWCAGDNMVEATDGTTGQTTDKSTNSRISRLAKINFYSSFETVCQKFNRHDLVDGLTYYQAKQRAKDFQQLKTNMIEHFKRNNLSDWVQKPIEEKMFT